MSAGSTRSGSTSSDQVKKNTKRNKHDFYFTFFKALLKRESLILQKKLRMRQGFSMVGFCINEPKRNGITGQERFSR